MRRRGGWPAGAVLAVAAVVTAGIPAAAAQATPGPEDGGSSGCPLPVFGPGAAYHPDIDPDGFSPDVTNRFFPQVVGRVLVYSGTKDGKAARDVTWASPRTRLVDGVRTRVVEDRLYLDGALEERTSDYYAQDRCGNVWYFGEDTAELDAGGHVTSTEGSFSAGVDGAQPGVFMQAHPQVGRQFRQEWFPGHAEDRYAVYDLAGAVTVPYGHFARALLTEEQTDLEPGVVDHKAYVAGIGEVSEVAVRGPVETLRLVRVVDEDPD
jgi:hypothetical protein